MKVLYISDRQPGGIVNHVKCLTSCLPPEVERYVIGVDGDEPFAGKSGHDWREWFQIRRVIRDFKPDVIHFHTIPLFMALYVKIVRLLDLRLFGLRLFGNLGKVGGDANNQTIKVFSSIHTPSGAVKVAFDRAVLNWAVEPCYWLPVSGANWRSFKTRYPKARGEVFFNPVRIGEGAELEGRVGVGGRERELERRVGVGGGKLEKRVGVGGEELKLRNPTISNPTIEQSNNLKSNNLKSNNQTIKQSNNFIVGMVGRNADQKDWPSFHKVEELVNGQFSGCLISDSLIEGAGKSNNPKSNNQTIPSVEFLNAGEHSLCDGRAAIRKMDLFLMTSKHEELPTTVLECFMERTPICGFIPRGGMEDILELSNGPLREVFIKERDCGKLADIVMDLLAHPKKRQALVEDGRQILEGHFDAEKNVRGRLMEVYGRVADAQGRQPDSSS